MMLGCGDGIVLKEHPPVGMGVDIHETGADEQPLRVDDLTAVGDGGTAHFPKTGNALALNEKNCLGNQMVTHDQNRVFNGKHMYSPYFCRSASSLRPSSIRNSATPALK